MMTGIWKSRKTVSWILLAQRIRKLIFNSEEIDDRGDDGDSDDDTEEAIGAANIGELIVKNTVLFTCNRLF